MNSLVLHEGMKLTDVRVCVCARRVCVCVCVRGLILVCGLFLVSGFLGGGLPVYCEWFV